MKNESAGAAWRKVVKTKNGEVEVLSIKIGETRYTAWPNSFKKPGEKTPDYRLQIDTYEPKEEAKPEPEPQPAQTYVQQTPANNTITDENDLPF